MKDIAHVLYQNACGIGNVIKITLGEVLQAGAGDQIEVFKGGVEAFTQAGVEVAVD
jgi:hypothetical protein